MTTTYKMLGGVLGSKALTLDQFDNFLDYVVNRGEGKEPQDLYKAVAWAFWCANLRADSVAQVPYAIYQQDSDEDIEENEFEDWPYDLTEHLWLVEMWLSLKGAAYALKLDNGRMHTGLRVLNANTMRVLEYDSNGPKVFRQEVGAQHIDFPAERIVYFRTFNPYDDINEGISSGQVGQVANELIKNANLWASRFFENGAIPSIILEAESQIPDDERERIRSVWKKALGGIRNVWEVMVLRKGLKPTVVSPPVKDLAMPDLERTKRDQILAANKIPPGLGEVKTNRAERDALQFEFWTQCIIPEIRVWLRVALNKQLFNSLGLRIGWHFNEIEVIQREEIAKAESAAFLVNGVMLPAYESNVVTYDEVRKVISEILGYCDLPELDKKFTPEERMPAPTVPGQRGEGPGNPTPPGANMGANTRPKAQPPREWGHLTVSLPSLAGGRQRQ